MQTEAVHLKRNLSLLNGVTLIIGSIIGSGIFVSPKGVLEYAGGSVGLAFIIWIASGFISMLGSLCFAELGTTFMMSGGEYTYLKEIFGPLPAFLQLWVNLVIIKPSGQAILALTFANYVLEPIFPDCDKPYIPKIFLAALAIMVLTYINIRSVRKAVLVQDVFTAAKVIALVLIIITGIVKFSQGNTSNYRNMFDSTTPVTAAGVAISLYMGLFAFSGWNVLNSVTEEIIKPEKNLPRSIYISISLVTVVYILTNAAFFVVLTPIEIIKSSAVAVTFGDRCYSFMAWIIPVFVSLSCFGGINGILFTTGRLAFVGARDGQLPDIMSMIHIHNLTPVAAILLNSVMSLFMLLSGNVYVLINYTSHVHWLSVAFCIIGMLVLRSTRPDMPRPLKVHWSIPVVFCLVSLYLLLIPLVMDTRNVIVGLLIVLAGVPVYWICVASDIKPHGFRSYMKKITIMTQKLLISVPEEHIAKPELKIN